MMDWGVKHLENLYTTQEKSEVKQKSVEVEDQQIYPRITSNRPSQP